MALKTTQLHEVFDVAPAILPTDLATKGNQQIPFASQAGTMTWNNYNYCGAAIPTIKNRSMFSLLWELSNIEIKICSGLKSGLKVLGSRLCLFFFSVTLLKKYLATSELKVLEVLNKKLHFELFSPLLSPEKLSSFLLSKTFSFNVIC